MWRETLTHAGKGYQENHENIPNFCLREQMGILPLVPAWSHSSSREYWNSHWHTHKNKRFQIKLKNCHEAECSWCWYRELIFLYSKKGNLNVICTILNQWLVLSRRSVFVCLCYNVVSIPRIMKQDCWLILLMVCELMPYFPWLSKVTFSSWLAQNWWLM